MGTGNNGHNGNGRPPACISSAIAVGASTNDEQNLRNANRIHSSLVKLMAPGLLDPGGGQFRPEPICLRHRHISRPAPHVAGAFALLRDRQNRKQTVDQILAALECTGKPIKRASDDKDEFKKPRIRLFNAWRNLTRPPTKPERCDFDKPSDADAWKTLSGKWRIFGKKWELGATGRRGDY